MMYEKDSVRGKYIMLDPTVQERQGCCHSVSPGPASSKAEDVFSVGIHTQKTHRIIDLFRLEKTFKIESNR